MEATSGINGRAPGPVGRNADHLIFRGKIAATGEPTARHRGDLSGGTRLDMGLGRSSLGMAYLNSRVFWDKKFKIALLVLASFAAMC